MKIATHFKNIFLSLLFIFSAQANEIQNNSQKSISQYFSKIEDLGWKKTQDNDEVSVYTKTGSDVVVTRVYENELSIQDTEDLFTNTDELNTIRQKMFSESGAGESQTISISKINLIDGKQVKGYQLESLLKDWNGKESHLYERQYYKSNLVYQVVLNTENLLSEEKIKALFDQIIPKLDRQPAQFSELMSSIKEKGQSLTKQRADQITEIKDQKLYPRILSDDECSKINIATSDRRETKASLDQKSTGTKVIDNLMKCNPVSTGLSCLSGVFSNLKSMVTGLKDLVVGLWNLATDSSKRASAYQTIAPIISQYIKDPLGSNQKLQFMIYKILANETQEFTCLNCTAQSKAICNFATNFIPAGAVVKVLSGTAKVGELAAAAGKAVKSVMAVVKESKVTQKVINVGEKINLVSKEVPIVTSLTKPLALKDFKKVVSRIGAALLKSKLQAPYSEEVESALNEVKNLKLNPPKINSRKIITEYNSGLMNTLDDTIEYAVGGKSTHPMRLKAMEAAADFARNNSDGYKSGILGRRAAESFQEVYYDVTISDDMRKIAYKEMDLAFKSHFNKGMPEFKSTKSIAEELRKTGEVAGPRW